MKRQTKEADRNAGRFVCLATMVGLLMGAALSAQAGTLLYWDANGADGGTGGTGNWDTTSLTWRVGSASGTLTNWFDGAAPRFGGTAGTVTLAENVAVNGANSGTAGQGIRFTVSGYTIEAGGGTLTIQNQDERPFAVTTGNVTINAPLHIARNGLIYFEGGGVTLNGSISVAGTSTQVGGWNGTLVLGGSNGFTGTQGNGGYNYTLQINHNNALNGKALWWGALWSVSAGTNNPTLTSAASLENDKMHAFSGNNSLSLGDTVYNWGNNNGFNVANAPAVLTFTSLQEGGVAYNQPFTKNGLGTLAISGRYSCGGKTTVNAGTMLINGSAGDRTGSSSYVAMPDWEIKSGATLGGTGTIWLATGKTNTVNAGGAIAPGATVSNSVGTLTVDGAVTLAEGALYKWEYADGVGDLVAVSGLLTLPATATVEIAGTGSIPGRPVRIFTFGSVSRTDLSGWTLSGAGARGFAGVRVDGADVLLIAKPAGAVFVVQ